MKQVDQDLAYRVQKWPRKLFAQESAQGGFMHAALQAMPGASWTGAVREIYGRLYGVGTSKLAETVPGNEWAEELHRQADSVPEFSDLLGRVSGDSWRAALAAGQVAQVLAQQMPQLPDENADDLERAAELAAERGQADDAQMLSARALVARQQSAAAVASMQKGQGFAIRSAVRKAARQAAQAVAEVDAAIAGLAPGTEQGQLERRAMATMLVSDERLKRIAAIAGRLKVQAARKQRTKVTQERREVVSVTKGDDLQRLLASEVGMLATPATRPFVLERILQKRALQFELGGKAEKTRGPIVFMIDKSGSMQGIPDEWSKGCALAMMEIARVQKRAFAVGFFTAGVCEQDSFFFEAGQVDQAKVLSMLAVQPCGGTDISKALHWARGVIAGEVVTHWTARAGADVVLITDGDDTSDVSVPAAALKALGASIYTITIGCAQQAVHQAMSSDSVVVNPNDMTGASSKLDAVFSV